MTRLDGQANALLRSVGSPAFLYGTAWKKETTAGLVQQALQAGFTAVDTANQPRHYREDLVGDGLRAALAAGTCARLQLFVQTKFTPPAGQDAGSLPYDGAAPLAAQIDASVAASLRHLRPRPDLASAADAYLDCLLLHAPLADDALTLAAWRALERHVPARARALGIANVGLPALQRLVAAAVVPPAVVQNRFHAATGFDADVRAFCARRGIVYQAFWTLTANPRLLDRGPAPRLARAAAVSAEAALYALVLDLGVAVLNGTTSQAHMRADLADLARLRDWAGQNADAWAECVREFREIVDAGTQSSPDSPSSDE